MIVRLLRYTENPEDLVRWAMSKCYDSSPTLESLQAAIKAGHTSLLEHVSFTWEIQGISRVVLAQLTRHRIASFTVRSQRYCDETEAEYYVPEELAPWHRKRYLQYLDWARTGYENLVASGVDKEIARYVLPQAIHTELVLTMNARELHDVFFPLRLSKRAQPEIRELAGHMLVDCCRVAPGIFGKQEDWEELKTFLLSWLTC